MEQEAHYRCAVTGELLPESELLEVPVYRLQTSGHDSMEREQVATVLVSGEVTGLDNYIGAKVLTAFGRVVMVCKETRIHSGCHDPQEMGSSELENWRVVAETALSDQ